MHRFEILAWDDAPAVMPSLLWNSIALSRIKCLLRSDCKNSGSGPSCCSIPAPESGDQYTFLHLETLRCVHSIRCELKANLGMFIDPTKSREKSSAGAPNTVTDFNSVLYLLNQMISRVQFWELSWVGVFVTLACFGEILTDAAGFCQFRWRRRGSRKSSSSGDGYDIRWFCSFN